MRFVHRLVVVAGFFLILPVGFFTLTAITGIGGKPATAGDFILAALMGWVVAGLVIYPVAWLFGGLSRQ
jgi:hypothetical protein